YTPICGRAIDCYKSLDKHFTAHLFYNEHHKIEDEVYFKDWYHQNLLGNYMKQVAANDTAFYERKYDPNPLELPLFRRLTETLNDEEEDVKILPVIGTSLLDKVTLYSCNDVRVPFETLTTADQLRFKQAWFRELPHWLYDLTKWEI